MKKIIFLMLLFLFIFLSKTNYVLAADFACECVGGGKFAVTDCKDCPDRCTDPVSGKGQKSCDASSKLSTPAPQTLPNPLGIVDINAFIAKIINFVLSLVGSVSLLLFVYGGITWMTSVGNSAQIKKGRDIIIWAIIGLAVVFTSYILVKFVIQGITTGA